MRPAIATASGSPTCGGAMTTRSNSPARSRSRSPILAVTTTLPFSAASSTHAVADFEAHRAHVGRGLAARRGVRVVRPAELAVEGELDDLGVRQLVRRFERLLREREAAGLRARRRQGADRTRRRSGRARCAWAWSRRRRRISPPVGPSGLMMRSNSHVVIDVGQVVGGSGLELELRAGRDDRRRRPCARRPRRRRRG